MIEKSSAKHQNLYLFAAAVSVRNYAMAEKHTVLSTTLTIVEEV